MSSESILIIGGGASGLAAADALSVEGISVTVLEARERIGGRIHSVKSCVDSIPIELGAEFIHGARNKTWRLVRAAGLATQKAPDSHWESINGVLIKNENFWDEVSAATKNINCKLPDQGFASYLASQHKLDDRSRGLATEYVEGFHAAPADVMSIHALKRAEERAEAEEGTRQFRLSDGYSQLIDWLASRINSRGAAIVCRQNVRIVRWKSGRVEVLAETPEGLQKHRGVAAIITLPLGVLQAEPEEGVFFNPELPDKRQAIRALHMGAALKVTLQFSERFWPIKNFGFIHSHEELFPVWWSDERGPILTAWTGGGRAAWLGRENRESIVAEAVATLSRLLNLNSRFIQKRIIGAYHNNWITDRFSCGAYSFTPPGKIRMSKELGEPISATLFFAGEATDSEGNQGTVQGALSSGQRAAREVLRAMKRLAPDPLTRET